MQRLRQSKKLAFTNKILKSAALRPKAPHFHPGYFSGSMVVVSPFDWNCS